MLIDFFLSLRNAKLKVSVREHLTLLEALQAGVLDDGAAGGSVDHHNGEPGAEWLQRLTQAFPKFVWINPEPQALWSYRQSIALIQQLMNQRMYPLTLPGLDAAMRTLSR